MRLVALVFVLFIAGCAPSVQTVATLDFVDGPPPLDVTTLLVVPVGPSDAEYWPLAAERAALARLTGASRARLDSADLVEAKNLRQRRLPLDSLGIDSYEAYAMSVLMEAVQERTSAETVASGALPTDSTMQEQAFAARIKRPRGNAGPRTFTRFYRAPRVGVPDQFGGGLVLLAENVTVRVQEGRTGVAPSSGTPTRENDLVLIGGRLTLWDDRVGQVVTTADVYASDDISRRSLGEVMRGEKESARMERALQALRVARERFADELADALPFLMEDA
ncbi:hypothetical protein [Rubricoccus marinus]|uniref:Flagellar assembly protein T C-terminal domain-containing protein n=1 Tax=Rubricoccus marinus TaxID=716817 RepID=A0A259U059_9BACT|nr:hypothetical protein [Rubricoccus marinus]OZC03330.1 hypothetical protein BSZ36_10265 [Rubricoccus marinus]